MRTVAHAQTVYFKLLPTAGSVTPFPLVPILADPRARVVGFIAHQNEEVGIAPDLSPIITPADSWNVTFTLNDGSDARFQDIPYFDANTLFGFTGIWYETEPFPIDLTKCLVRTNGNIAPGSAAAFTFLYILTDVDVSDAR